MINMHNPAFVANILAAWAAWQGIMPAKNKLTPAQIKHGERVAERARVNGQPNGYKPFTEREWQEMHRKV